MELWVCDFLVDHERVASTFGCVTLGLDESFSVLQCDSQNLSLMVQVCWTLVNA